MRLGIVPTVAIALLLAPSPALASGPQTYAIDPVSGKLAIIYTNDTLTTDSNGNPLPQVELARQN